MPDGMGQIDFYPLYALSSPSLPLAHMSSPATRQFKILVVGDGNVGKTTYVHRLKTGEFAVPCSAPHQGPSNETLLTFYPTPYVDVGAPAAAGDRPPLPAKVEVRCVDVLADCKYAGLRDSIYIDADAVIVMFDVTNRGSFLNAVKWYREVYRCLPTICRPAIPAVLVANKIDCRQQQVRPNDTFDGIGGLKMTRIDLSSKSNYNFERPWKYLLSKLLGQEVTFKCGDEDEDEGKSPPPEPEAQQPLASEVPDEPAQDWVVISDQVRQRCLASLNAASSAGSVSSTEANKLRLVGLASLAWDLQPKSVREFIADRRVRELLGKAWSESLFE